MWAASSSSSVGLCQLTGRCLGGIRNGGVGRKLSSVLVYSVGAELLVQLPLKLERKDVQKSGIRRAVMWWVSFFFFFFFLDWQTSDLILWSQNRVSETLTCVIFSENRNYYLKCTGYSTNLVTIYTIYNIHPLDLHLSVKAIYYHPPLIRKSRVSVVLPTPCCCLASWLVHLVLCHYYLRLLGWNHGLGGTGEGVIPNAQCRGGSGSLPLHVGPGLGPGGIDSYNHYWNCYLMNKASFKCFGA